MEPEAVIEPGVYVLYKDIESHEQAKQIADKLLEAGATRGQGYPYLENDEDWLAIGWSEDGHTTRWLIEPRLDASTRLTPDEVLRGRHPMRGKSADSVIVDDEVNQPSHYKRKSSDVLRAVRAALLEDGEVVDLECIEAMLSHLSTVDQIRGYLRGNSFKYRWRYEDKDRLRSLRKADWYERKLEELEVIVEEHNAA